MIPARRRRFDGNRSAEPAFAIARAILTARGQPSVVGGGAGGLNPPPPRRSVVRQVTEVLRRTTSTGSVRSGRPGTVRGEAAMRGVSEYQVQKEIAEAKARTRARSEHRVATAEELRAARLVGAGRGGRVGAGRLAPITLIGAEGNLVQIVPVNAGQRAKLGKVKGAVEVFARRGDTKALTELANYRPQGIDLAVDPDILEAILADNPELLRELGST